MAGDKAFPASIISSVFSGMGSGLNYIHHHIMYLNSSKFFAGVVMILLNVGSKFITIQFSRSTEEYLKMVVSKQILVFAMAWMGTRDIYTALVLVAVFTILSDYAFDETSPFCIVPDKYRVLSKVIDINDDGEVTEIEMADAIATLDKAKRQKKRTNDRNNLAMFHNYLSL